MTEKRISITEFCETIKHLETQRQIIEAIKAGMLFDYIANYGHDFTKHELIDIIKGLDYAIYSVDELTKNQICKTAIESLSERWSLNEE